MAVWAKTLHLLETVELPNTSTHVQATDLHKTHVQATDLHKTHVQATRPTQDTSTSNKTHTRHMYKQQDPHKTPVQAKPTHSIGD